VSQERFIAAFDIATAVGACDGLVGARPRVWTWWLDDAGKSRPIKLCYFRRLLDEYFSSVHVDAVYYEAPMNLRAMMSMGTSDDTIALLRGAVGVIESCAAHHGVQVIESVPVQDARQALTGKRTFAKVKGKNAAKEAIMATARMMGVDVATDHEADAYAVYWYACAKHNPRIAHLVTELFSVARAPVV
jgi:hypothetical protein